MTNTRLDDPANQAMLRASIRQQMADNAHNFTGLTPSQRLARPRTNNSAKR